MYNHKDTSLKKWRSIQRYVAAIVLQYYIFDNSYARKLTWERRAEIKKYINSTGIQLSRSGKLWIPHPRWFFIDKMAEQIINFHNEEDKNG